MKFYCFCFWCTPAVIYSFLGLWSYFQQSLQQQKKFLSTYYKISLRFYCNPYFSILKFFIPHILYAKQKILSRRKCNAMTFNTFKAIHNFTEHMITLSKKTQLARLTVCKLASLQLHVPSWQFEIISRRQITHFCINKIFENNIFYYSSNYITKNQISIWWSWIKIWSTLLYQ